VDCVAQPRKVLVVDDERPVAITLSAILEAEGYKTAIAFSGEEAMGVAARFRPDFLLSDIRMPGINGVDAALRILEFLPGCCVLFISGFPADEALAGARTRGFNFQVCSKPIPPPELLGKIADIIARPTPPPLTVLHVDNDEVFRYAVSRILRHAGFKVLEAGSGEEALRLAKTRPDAILLDIHLPDMSSFEVCRQLKNAPETAGIPVVYLTDTANDDVSQNLARQPGVEAYFTHPIDTERLCALLRSLGERKLRPHE
jgi:CheY-like chemotaxis protein